MAQFVAMNTKVKMLELIDLFALAYARERRDAIVVWDAISPWCECVWLLPCRPRLEK